MDKEIRIETLRMAIRYNTRMLALVPKGSDQMTEARVQADKEELAKLEAA